MRKKEWLIAHERLSSKANRCARSRTTPDRDSLKIIPALLGDTNERFP
jgi:hypothetical protein